jgi:hypothetical protein
MAAAGRVGARLGPLTGHGELFSEAGSRVLICTPDPDAVVAGAAAAGVAAWPCGEVGGDRLVVADLVDLALAAVVEAQGSSLESVMESAGTGRALPA